MEEEELAEPCTSPSESVRRKEQDESVVHRQMEQGEGEVARAQTPDPLLNPTPAAQRRRGHGDGWEEEELIADFVGPSSTTSRRVVCRRESANARERSL
jgi:hypothetical protein